MKKNLTFLLFLLLSVSIFAQNNLLQNGPMLGYSTMNEIMIWAQTTEEAEIKIAYYTSSSDSKWTNTVLTTKDKSFTAHLLADEIKPNTTYFYDIYINNKKVEIGHETSFTTKPVWAFRTDPPNFSFAAGSGTYINETEFDRPGKPYGGNYEVFESIAEKQPNFMLWLGDNIYLRQKEWNSKTGIAHRYTHTRSTAEMQKLLSNVHNYAIIDDHDMGANNCDGSYALKNISIEAFTNFWANPPQVANLNSATYYFNWNDVDFFLLDNRYYRSPNYLEADDKTQLGAEQLEWLKDAIVNSNASFKFIVLGGQFLTTLQDWETYSNYGFDQERQEIIDFIYNQEIKNVVFLTGDRHFTELSILTKNDKPTIYDLTLSALTSGSNTHALEEENDNRIEGTVVMKRNFGVISFSGTKDERIMKINVCDTNGNEIWTKEFVRE